MQVKQVTSEILKELEILSDTDGRYILHLAMMYSIIWQLFIIRVLFHSQNLACGKPSCGLVASSYGE